jgi:hypothetical protein
MAPRAGWLSVRKCASEIPPARSFFLTRTHKQARVRTLIVAKSFLSANLNCSR